MNTETTKTKEGENEDIGYDPWAAGMTPEFIAWAEQVAELDATFGGWDALLKDTAQRRWLVMGILLKIFRVKVWEVDLFGCGEEQGKLLVQQSRTFMGDERHEGSCTSLFLRTFGLGWSGMLT